MSQYSQGNIVINSEEYENLTFLDEKGPLSADALPNDKTQGLLNQQLIQKEADKLSITDKGESFLEEVAQAEAEAQKEEEEEETGNELDDEVAKSEMKRANESTKVAAEQMVMESLSNLISDFIPTLQNGFSAIINSVKPGVKMETETDPENVIKKIYDVPYVNLSQLPVPVPEGFQTKYLTYTHILERAVTRAEQVEKRMKSFTTFVADILTNSESRLKSEFNQAFYLELDKDREDVYATIGACFQAGSNNTKLKYGKLVDRNRDWELVFSKGQDLAKRMNGIDRQGLLKASKHLKDLLNKVKQAADRGGFDITSPEVIKNLSEGSYQIASELEFYSVIFYRVNVLVEVLRQDSVALKQAINP